MIKGFIRGENPYIKVKITSTLLRNAYETAMLIDLGASRTVLSPRDALSAGLDYESLVPDEDFGGIGGSVPSGIIPDATLEFADHEPINLPIHVLKYSLETLSEDECNLVMEMPSLLGVDVINQFDLFYSHPKGRIELNPC